MQILADTTDDGRSLVLVADGPTAELAHLAPRLRHLTAAMRPTEPRGGVIAPLSWPLVVQLAAEFGDAWAPAPDLAEWTAAQLEDRLPDDVSPKYTPPPGMMPRAYQNDGAMMIGLSGSALLFDDPGVGKTVTTLLGLAERELRGHQVTPIVVVAPNAVIDSWVNHVRDWTPHWAAVAWRGTPNKRRALSGTADVYVVSYGTLRRDVPGPLLDLTPATVVCDEVHQTKNAETVQSRAARRLAEGVGQFVALSGTPITHHPADLWPALSCLEPGAWPSRHRWVKRYCVTVAGQFGDEILGLSPPREPEFRATIVGRHRRVAKSDVLSELPPKVYSTRVVDLPASWRRTYDQMEAEELAAMPDGEELSAIGILAQMTRLSQLACAAADVETTVEVTDSGEEKVHQKVTLKAPSWKVDELLEILAERPGQHTAVYAPSRQLIMLAGQAASDAGYKVGYVVGGQSATERTGYVEAFQRGELDLICLTTGAGGVGLTLTAASCAVFLQRPWSIVESIQAEDRQHRIGSERHGCVEIVDVIARDTIDTRVRAVLRDRAGALSDMVQDPRVAAELLGGKSVPE